MAEMTMAQAEEKLKYILKGHELIVDRLKGVSDPVTKLEDMEQLVTALELALKLVSAEAQKEQAEANVRAKVKALVRCPKCKNTTGLVHSWDAYEKASILGIDEHGDEVFSTLMDTTSNDDTRIDCTNCDQELDWDDVEEVLDEEQHKYSDQGGNGYCFECGLTEDHEAANHIK